MKTKWKKIAPPELLKVGDRVCLSGELRGRSDGSREVTGTREYGVVVQTWNSTKWQDCYVAFHGFKKNFESKKQPQYPPYVLRYHYTSLEKL